MKDLIIKNSVIMRAAIKCIAFARSELGKADMLLKSVNKYSMADRALRSAARGAYRYIAKIYAGADILKKINGVILATLRVIVRETAGFICRVYCGSFVLEIFGRAAVNSRCLKLR